MKVLVGYEHSAMVASAFRQFGHEAWSCDIRECSGESPWEDKKVSSHFHITGDIWNVLNENEKWDIAIFHPPCTYLSVASLKWLDPKYEYKNKPGGALFGRLRQKAVQKSLDEFKRLWRLDICRICIENPVNIVSSKLGIPSTQSIQPYQFGHDASKRTCFWLKNLPKIKPLPVEFWVPPRFVCPKCSKYPRSECTETTGACKIARRWGNQSDWDGSYASPTNAVKAERAKERAITYPGIALEMAKTWNFTEIGEKN